MSTTGHRYERIASAAVAAAFAAFWMIVVAVEEPPEFPRMYFFFALVVAVLATLWIVAVRVICRRWPALAAPDAGTTDGPALLVTAAAAALPEDRREWGAAMAAELGHVPGRAARWRFAAGCAWTALFPPRGSYAPLAATAALAVAASIFGSVAVERMLPAMHVFTMAFIAGVGVLAALAVARGRHSRLTISRLAIAMLGTTGVIACIASTAWFLLEHPDAADRFSAPAAVKLAALLAACVALALAPPRVLSGDWLAPVFGAGAALTLGAGFLWVARLSVDTTVGPLVWTLFAPIVVLPVVAAFAAASRRSFAIGVQTAFWATLLSSLLIFALALPEAARRFALDGRTLSDGELGLPIGVNLPDAIWGLTQIPVFGFPFGVFGAALGAAISRWLPTRSRDERRSFSG